MFTIELKAIKEEPEVAKTIYKCSVCDEEVSLEDSVLRRKCDHNGASIKAFVSATVYGFSTLD